MEPITGTPTRRGFVDRLAICVLIGVLAASVGGVALLTVYLNRVGAAAEGLERVDALPGYPGRPSPVSVDGVSAVNFLLMATDEKGALQAVLIAHLSASRADLALVALPANLLVGDGGATLAQTFSQDPLVTTRAVETLTAARMDHQLHLDLSGFADVVDSLDGIDLAGAHLDGAGVRAHLAAAKDDLDRSVRTADLLRAALARAGMGVAIADPNRFDKVMDALTPCLVVDTDLTTDEIRTTLVESRVRADEVVTWPLVTTPVGPAGQADAAALASLRVALAGDVVAPPGGNSPVAASGPSPSATR